MREGRPSMTAMFVAYARAIATEEPDLRGICQDPLAARLLPNPFRGLLEMAAGSPQPPLAYRALRYGTFGLADHLAARTHLIDAAVERATGRGVRQLVVLGAGLDSRAHRMECLRDTVVFEVDHPNTQRLKTRKTRALPRKARELRYAACDFAQITLEQALAAQGFSTAEPTVWIWEGVTMYLEEAAVEASLATLSSLSATGSTLIATYVNPSVGALANPIHQMSLATLSLISEPVRMSSTAPQMNARLARHGFEVETDVIPVRAAASLGAPRIRRMIGTPPEHLVVAHKR